MPLDEAAHGRDTRSAGVRGLGGIEDRRYRLLFGRVDEAAGIDDDDVGAAGRGGVVPGGAEPRLERI
jgi:hypothetical protein